MPIAFDRSICCDLNETISREWLVTNGLGGYAAGTVAGMLTRMQHGLLVVSPAEATEDAATPQLLLAKIDEEIVFDERTYYLGTNEYTDGMLSPSGFAHLETFRLEEGFPVFTYHLGGIDGIMLEKRIWMPHGYNTTYIQYRVLRSRIDADSDADRAGMRSFAFAQDDNKPGRKVVSGHGNRGTSPSFLAYPEASQRVLSLTLLPFSAHRPHHQPQYGNNDWHFQVQVHSSEPPAAIILSAAKDLSAVGAINRPLQLPRGVAGCSIRAWDGALPYSIFAVGHPDSQTTFIPTGVWYWHFLRRHEQAAGRSAIDDLYLPGVIRTKLWPGEDATLTIIATTEELSSLTFSSSWLNLSYKHSLDRQIEFASDFLQPQRYFGEGGETSHSINVLPLPTSSDETYADREGETFLRLLLQAADRFLIYRPLPHSEQGAFERLFFRSPESSPVILSDYYGLEDSTRDMLIALSGLTLVTRRYDEARHILRNLARYFQHGMLPDRFCLGAINRAPTEHNYGSVDTTLWYFYALDQYVQATNDYEFLDDLYQRLVESIDWYILGTYNGIQVDACDGLLRAAQPGKALTWMNASIDGVPVTPRQGKPVEVNALWYHALSLMHEWSQRQQRLDSNITSHTPSYYKELATRCKQSFHQRFLGRDQPRGRDKSGHGNSGASPYLYDVIDGPDGDDASMRPNQLLALSLRYPLLDKEYRQAVFDLVTQHLVTPYGLRTLAPQEAGYRGELKEDQQEQQQTLHQGSVWPWLIGPYIDAMLNIPPGYPPGAPLPWTKWQKGLAILEPFRKQFSTGLLGMIGGVYNGDSSTGYKPASALSVGEILRVYNLFVHQQVQRPVDLLPVNRLSTRLGTRDTSTQNKHE
ncbi:MAG: amylo-alpha-1,6-glucosidase [Ktedonobacteraceae bacterium]